MKGSPVVSRLSYLFRDPEKIGFVGWAIPTFVFGLLAVVLTYRGSIAALLFLIPAGINGYFAMRAWKAGYS